MGFGLGFAQATVEVVLMKRAGFLLAMAVVPTGLSRNKPGSA